MRDFMIFCLEILQHLVNLFLCFDLGGYSYGNFLVVCLLVSSLIGALVIKFTPGRSDYASRPPKLHSSGGSRGSYRSGGGSG